MRFPAGIQDGPTCTQDGHDEYIDPAGCDDKTDHCYDTDGVDVVVDGDDDDDDADADDDDGEKE
eukprot:9845-Pyramimonas_sp.AAC.1